MIANGLPGYYIVLDGIIGCGKTAQRKILETHLPLDFPSQKFIFTYEPGGNEEADKIRQRLKYEVMTPEKEMELFAESRRITLPQVVVPTLSEGGVVVSDRSVTTSLAYQAFGRKLGLDRVWRANERAVNGILPDLVIWMNVGLEACLKRSGGENPDKFDKESQDFWKRTVPGFAGMLAFVKSISPYTKTITINDPDGSTQIEPMREIIKQELYPELRLFFQNEGRIVRERQL